jgi:hypothetical protein
MTTFDWCVGISSGMRGKVRGFGNILKSGKNPRMYSEQTMVNALDDFIPELCVKIAKYFMASVRIGFPVFQNSCHVY